MSSLQGLILFSREFGYCKITDHSGQRVRVRFCGNNREVTYTAAQVAAQRDFWWRPLPVGLKCRVEGRGVCTVIQPSFRVNDASHVHEYVVQFDGVADDTARLGERELWPIPDSLVETPLSRTVSLQPDSIAHYRSREAFTSAICQLHRESSGIGALAASRVALLPHQAFVVGTVVNDPIWRYVLADEVGLGKTVEAGAIAHQLLASRPDARVLILCPGPLARQWLCEMHMSFGGRDFRLLDLHDSQKVQLQAWNCVISSIKVAMRDRAQDILANSWDLVVVDEAHHLLWNLAQYEFIAELAARSPRLLLLSAIPAREREAELLRLLRLIDPARYQEGTAVANRFAELYAAQRVIGRRVRMVSQHLSESSNEDMEFLHEDARRLLASDILNEDKDLEALRIAAEQAASPEDVRSRYEELIDQVVARYRISRRILKNRRARLVDKELLSSVARSISAFRYEAGELEREIGLLAMEVLQSASLAPIDRVALHTLFRKTAQALCDPAALYQIAVALRYYDESDSPEGELLDANAAYDYEEHDEVIASIASLVGPHVDKNALERWHSLLVAAIDLSAQPRILALRKCVAQLREGGAKKVIVFVGTYGTAEFVADMLASQHGKAAIATFFHDQEDDWKERQVTRFRRDAACWILVSDESGGEGRNFQFADAIVHFDLPWSVSAVEQRIGRLDRIGRDRPVHSIVLSPSDTVEADWFECLEGGFGVFTKSISGLEFMLRQSERRIIESALEHGSQSLVELTATIRDECERERASDDADALTDAASFRSSIKYLHAIESSADSQLEKAVPSYFRTIARSDAARQVTDTKDPNLRLWRFRPEDVADFQLVGLERRGDNPLQEKYGTFARSVARERPDLDFFSIGHPLIDGLRDACKRHIRGRTFVAKVTSSKLAAGQYILVGWRCATGGEEASDETIDGAIRHLQDRHLRVALDIASGECLSDIAVSEIAELLSEETAGISDLQREPMLEALEPYLEEWGTLIPRLINASEARARLLYLARYGADDEEFCERMRAELSLVARTRHDETPDYEKSLLASVAAVKSATVALDSIGIIVVPDR
ncbi:SNF2-related protein [Variovorax sp. J22R133]|uniref:SNF2-related protein n=1 Tax=Variovorax brevis TaxID=3053503 RepID=UPI002575C8A3|nr:SNF2-related protein [Variovorax sp. J22R133]MDM0117528.1 SNF2-related protein [Variovorax sp. J22R133]